MQDKEFHIILKKYLKGKSTPEEIRAIEAFYQKNQEKDLFDVYTLQEEKEAKALIRVRVMKKVWLEKEKSESIPRFRGIKIAASIALLIVAFALYFLSTNTPAINYITKATEKGLRSTITLTDGSLVYLNAESSITFPEDFNNQPKREITLEGEAFFEVKRNEKKPFVVRSGSLNTTVLGTSFNINAYPESGQTVVTVASGKVKVDHSDRTESLNQSGMDKYDELYLEKAAQAIFDKQTGSLKKQKVDLQTYIGWKQNIITFDDIPLEEAILLLERRFNVTIDLQGTDKRTCHITGTFKDEQLVNILESMKFVSGITYEFTTENTININGGDCKN